MFDAPRLPLSGAGSLPFIASSRSRLPPVSFPSDGKWQLLADPLPVKQSILRIIQLSEYDVQREITTLDYFARLGGVEVAGMSLNQTDRTPRKQAVKNG